MKYSHTSTRIVWLVVLVALASSLCVVKAVLVQPYNYMLDDSSLLGDQHDASGSLSPYLNYASADQQSADKDIISIIGEGLARLRYARMLDGSSSSSADASGLSQEMAELLQNERNAKQDNGEGPSGLLMNVAHAAAQAFAADESSQSSSSLDGSHISGQSGDMSPRGDSIMELETSPSSSSASMPSKSDLKVGPSQWFNPKEVIPVLKISSMATPSKYKKVYFRSEKKLVDGAFHSPSSEHNEKKSFIKPFNSGVQRRSSRGTASSAPPGVFQDGFVDFVKKFRDVYVQTRPAVGSSSSSSALSSPISSSFASNVLSAASPFVAALGAAPGSRPNLASALSAASSMMSGQSSSSASSGSSSSSSLFASASSPLESAASSAIGSSLASSAIAPSSGVAGSAGSPSKSPLTAQSYVSFWSKTFPTWVRKMLKQLRRRSLQNSSKRQKQHNHSSNAAKLGQAAQAAASVASSVAQSTGDSSSNPLSSH